MISYLEVIIRSITAIRFQEAQKGHLCANKATNNISEYLFALFI